ncbi:MAG: DinB family protein [Planctomycetes bacterium]|nr:DinB family protein [Planctomycetota bacterium]MCH9727089.1 DinB family protein [Planctomycetota bacterium]MCH9775032.1 DinB family protein [Planctomycetota bacterium]MCH9793492.1 DinB family protein [Planctomycetota bacterium]
MSVSLISRLHEHRLWVNQSLLDSARTLSESQRRQTFPMGQGSIWDSLLHLYAAEYVWIEALQGDETPEVPGDLPGELPGNQKGEGRIQSLMELQQKWAELDQRWIHYLEQLTDDSMEELVGKSSTSSGKGRVHRTKRSDVLLHVCTHAQYTTAQIVNMLRQVGATCLPDPMLITLARIQMAAFAD